MGEKLKITTTNFQDLFIIQPNIFQDERGSFSRVVCMKEMEGLFQTNIKQVNHSKTAQKGTVRGLHFQYPPHTEIKMIKCIRGKVFDVAVDVRGDSDTFLQAFCIELSEENECMVYIPEGFAHGFQTLENDTELLYFHSNFYIDSNEGGLNIQDPKLNIQWPLDVCNLSKRDKNHEWTTENFKGIMINEM